MNNYTFNVSMCGKHLFATAEHSCTTVEEAERVTIVLSHKFPKSEGYEVSVTYRETTGRMRSLDDLWRGERPAQVLEELQS